MRDIKFRAWDKDDKEMVSNVQDKSLTAPSGFCTGGNHFGYFLNHGAFEIMQFTGLLDKNGKEIYEGDIVNLKVYLRSGDIRPAVVICESLGFMYLKACDNGVEYGTLHIGEVIGNIHENPELIKESK